MSPRRVAVGFESSRLALLLAVLHRHGGVSSSGQDVFVNVVGGVRIGETAADLPAVLAVLSSLRDRPVATDMVCFGELGLTGEIRPVPFGEERLREAREAGIPRALVPKAQRAAQPRSTASRSRASAASTRRYWPRSEGRAGSAGAAAIGFSRTVFTALSPSAGRRASSR